MKIEIKGKVGLVSGSNRGIGKSIVEELLEKGTKKLYAGARNVESLREMKEKYGDRLIPIELDVSSNQSISNAANQIDDLDILVNNAGVLSVGNFTNGNLLESLQQNLEVNLWGLIQLTDAFIAKMRTKKSAAIVCLSSVAGLANIPSITTYSISKAAVHSAIQGLRGELKDTNVLVAGVYPGPIDTDMAKGFEAEKESPKNVAKAIINSLEEGVEDIFPDPVSVQISSAYSTSPKSLENQFSGMS